MTTPTECCATCAMCEELPGDALLCLETLARTTPDGVCELWRPFARESRDE